MNSSDLHGELERLHRDCFGWALCCCRHRREEAEEALQTAYLKVLEGRARFHGQSSLRTWLFGVIRHTAAEQRRRRWLRDALLLNWYSQMPPPVHSDQEEALGGTERNRELRNALENLPVRQREVLHLVFYQGMTVDDAALTLQIAKGTARIHFERGKARLRQILAESGSAQQFVMKKEAP